MKTTKTTMHIERRAAFHERIVSYECDSSLIAVEPRGGFAE